MSGVNLATNVFGWKVLSNHNVNHEHEYEVTFDLGWHIFGSLRL